MPIDSPLDGLATASRGSICNESISRASMTAETATATTEPPIRQTPQSAAAAVGALVATSAAYYFGALLGFQLRFPDSPHSVLWPPNAVLLAALMLMPMRLWPWCVLSVLPAHVAISLPAGVPWMALFGFYFTNTAQAVLGAALFKAFTVRRGIESAHVRTIIFIASGVFISPIILSFADVAIAVGTGWSTNTYWQAWSLRFLSNAASAAIIVPPVIAAADLYRKWRNPPPKRFLEAALLALSVVALASFAFLGGASFTTGLPLLFCAYLPLLLWAAMRFGQAGASWTLLGLATATMSSIAQWPAGNAGQTEILMQQAIFLLIAIPVLYLGSIYSELRHTVRQLNTAAERQDMATKAASIGVWEWHSQTDRLYVDPHLKLLIGFENHEVPNTRSAWMSHYHPEDVEKIMVMVQACISGETRSIEVEHRMVHRDGSTRWLLTRGAKVRDDNDGTVKLLGTCVDVTERKRIEEELHNLRNELTHLTRVRMMGELSGALAHEINQPLAAILSNSQAAQLMLKSNPPDLAELEQVHEEIAESAMRAGNVIHGLRDLLRKGEPNFQPLDINLVVAEVLDLAHSDFVSHQVTVTRQFGRRIRIVRGDRIQIQQVVLNFIMNACEAMDCTRGERILTVTTRTNVDQSVQVSIEDTGRGIAPEFVDHLFEPFSTSKKNGLGLGLSISRTIVAAHGGRQWAENRPAGGAVFHFLLPSYPSSSA
jgi:two-component system, LuxR family, sensor kinase FixL